MGRAYEVRKASIQKTGAAKTSHRTQSYLILLSQNLPGGNGMLLQHYLSSPWSSSFLPAISLKPMKIIKTAITTSGKLSIIGYNSSQ